MAVPDAALEHGRMMRWLNWLAAVIILAAVEVVWGITKPLDTRGSVPAS